MADCLERVPVSSGNPAEQSRKVGPGWMPGTRAALWRYPAAASPHVSYSSPPRACLGRAEPTPMSTQEDAVSR
jgi:hypothetical protein